MKKTTKTTKVKKAPVYIASLKVLGKTFDSKGESVTEAISNIKIGGVAKGISILTVSNGAMVRQRILTAPQTFRLFNGGRIMKEVALKNISLLFT